MTLARRRSRLSILVIVFASMVAVLGGVSAVARWHAPHRGRATVPLRAVIYETAPARSVAGRWSAAKMRTGAAAVRSHLAALAWARADAAIVRWDGPGTVSDRKLKALLVGIAATGGNVRAAVLIERARGGAQVQLRALARSRGTSQNYLHIASRPAAFVALRDRAQRTCKQARRLRAAASGLWLARTEFVGYERCLAAADAWFRDRPVTRTARARGSFLIRPGYWAPGDRTPRVPRSLAAWRRSIAQMVASRAPLQIIDSLNDWTHGSAIEASRAWPSASGYGAYLDALHAVPPTVQPGAPSPVQTGAPSPVQSGTAPPVQSGAPDRPQPALPPTPPVPGAPPTVGTAVVSSVTAHQATISSTVSSGTSPATWWVEFGFTTAYGQVTSPVALAAGSPPRPVSVALPSLSAGVGYLARVVVTSSVGRVTSPDVTFTTPIDSQAMRIAAAGDIACDPNEVDFNGGLGTATACRQRATSNAILAGDYKAVLPLGDVQYNAGTAAGFAASYNPSWGRLKSITHPAVGNHEYGSPGAGPYFSYFGASAGHAGQGWYSFDVGAWHLIALNSNCAIAGGCGTGSPQELWLRADLAAHPVACTLAYWHHPLFTSGHEGPTPEMTAIWNDLLTARADVVLNGHEHHYERFAPQTTTGQRDDTNGIREIVVGTGGENHMSFRANLAANSEARDSSSFGFLELTLSTGAYSWRFVSAPQSGFSDSGSGACH